MISALSSPWHNDCSIFWCEHQQNSQEDTLPSPGEGRAAPAVPRARGSGAVPSVPGRAGGGVGRTEAHLGQGAVRAEHQAAHTSWCLCPPCCHPHQPWRCPRSAVPRAEPLLTVPGAALKRDRVGGHVGRAGQLPPGSPLLLEGPKGAFPHGASVGHPPLMSACKLQWRFAGPRLWDCAIAGLHFTFLQHRTSQRHFFGERRRDLMVSVAWKPCD